MLLLGSCSSDSDEILPPDPDPTVPDTGFALPLPQSPVLLEEGSNPISVPVSIVRAAGEQKIVTLSLQSSELQAYPNLSASFVSAELPVDVDQTQLTLSYALSPNPIMAQSFDLLLTATDGTMTQTQEINVELSPTSAPDVYLLIGQSNMVASSEMGAKQALAGGPEEPDPRIRQLNVTANERSRYNLDSDYTDISNIVASPALITAEVPLHEPNTGSGKSGTQIGLGLSFSKAALANTSSDIVLVPAAFGGTGFCSIGDSPNAWNNVLRDSEFLGRTGLYDRAVARTNHALQLTDGILRGILWLQGETDGDREACADLYADNLRQMADALFNDIQQDARGSIARGPSSDIPFVLGTMSRGADSRGDFSDFTQAKQQVDNVHRTISSSRPNTGLVNNDDLVPPGFACGADSCIHFGADAYREMGVRYYNTMQQLW